MNVRILAGHNIGDDSARCLLSKVAAINAAAYVAQGLQRLGVRGDDAVAILEGKSAPGGFGQTRFVDLEPLRCDLVESCNDLSIAGTQNNPIVRGETLGASDRHPQGERELHRPGCLAANRRSSRGFVVAVLARVAGEALFRLA